MIAERRGGKLVLLEGLQPIGHYTFPSGTVMAFLPHSLDINPTGAATLVRDKYATTQLIHSWGYPSVVSWRFDFKSTQQSFKASVLAEAMELALSLSPPVVLKPTFGSRGRNVFICVTAAEIANALNELALLEDSVIVQPYVDGRDFRIVVLNGRILSACERSPLSIVGDGSSTINELLDVQMDHLGRIVEVVEVRRSVEQRLRHAGQTLLTIPSKGEIVPACYQANLMAGGTATDLTSEIDQEFAKIAIDIVGRMGLLFGSVDLISKGSIRAKPSQFYVIEVNSAPGLEIFLDKGESLKETWQLYDEVLQVFDALRIASNRA